MPKINGNQIAPRAVIEHDGWISVLMAACLGPKVPLAFPGPLNFAEGIAAAAQPF
jgi:hypothetical protein